MHFFYYLIITRNNNYSFRATSPHRVCNNRVEIVVIPLPLMDYYHHTMYYNNCLIFICLDKTKTNIYPLFIEDLSNGKILYHSIFQYTFEGLRLSRFRVVWRQEMRRRCESFGLGRHKFINILWIRNASRTRRKVGNGVP